MCPFWARLGHRLHENGRVLVQDGREGAPSPPPDLTRSPSVLTDRCWLSLSQVKNFAVVYVVDTTEVCGGGELARGVG